MKEFGRCRVGGKWLCVCDKEKFGYIVVVL